MTKPEHNGHVDVEFSVPLTHRLRFTRDVLNDDTDVLLDLLSASAQSPPRVQFWVDQHVADAQPQIAARLRKLASDHRDRFQMAGNIQFVPGGEAVKNDIHILERILKVFNAADLDRRSYVVVIGGGAVLDAVGFCAAIAHRGIRLVRLPTTTLAQGDSGIGVKNAANLFNKKNWIGAFAVPWGVVNDAALLTTLPDRDFVCGFSESVKVSLLKDAEFFSRICRDAHLVRQRDMQAAQPIIVETARWHLQHITRGGDPFEALEARPLDYGHWSAHKLETMTNFEVSHGEAVAIGVAVDTVYSSMVHGLPTHEADRVLHCLADMGMPLHHPALHTTETLFQGLEEFRQHLGGRLTVTMLRDVGDPINVHEIDRPAMLKAIAHVADFAAQSSKSA